MINCDKRQKEVKDGVEQHRCIERKAEPYLQIVDEPTCQACPILALKNKKGCGGVAQPAWTNELLSVSTVKTEELTVTPHEKEQGYEKPCPYRMNGKCQVTGHQINPEICKACDQETAEHMATLPEMAVGFANEVKRWIRHGRPVRTDEEVKYILETYCKKCDMYDPEKEACKKCGCAMNDSSWPLLNGIKMKTKICPMKIWR